MTPFIFYISITLSPIATIKENKGRDRVFTAPIKQVTDFHKTLWGVFYKKNKPYGDRG